MNAAQSTVVSIGGVSPDATVVEYLKPFRQYLDLPDLNEICLNRPGELFLERSDGWQKVEVPTLTFHHCRSLAGAIATLSGQFTNENSPLLGAPLPTGERIQFVQPSATAAGIVAVCIRKPSTFLPRLDRFEAQGLFARIRPNTQQLKPHEHELLALKEEGRFAEFLQRAVQLHQTIVVAGKTGSGKTTFMKALVEEVPRHERAITIEDTAELLLPSHDTSCTSSTRRTRKAPPP